MFQYTDNFVDINFHLNKLYDGIDSIDDNINQQLEECCKKNPKIYSFNRTPPIILNYEDECKQNLKNMFNYKDTIFKPHTIYYTEHELHSYCDMEDVPRVSNINEDNIYIDAFMKWNHGFYHFMTEALPMILYINKNTNKQYDIYTFNYSFIRDILNYFEIKNNVIYVLPKDKFGALRIKSIECGTPSIEKIDLIRDFICKKEQFTPMYGIIIYRKEKTRYIHNFTELVDMVKEVYPQIQWYIFDQLPLHVSAKLFSGAKIIIGAHGAGLTNMLFAPTGTTIIELMNLEVPNLCYWHLAQTLKHKHYIISCPTVNNQFTINIPEVKPLLEVLS